MTAAAIALAASCAVQIAAIQRRLGNVEHAGLCIAAAIGLGIVACVETFSGGQS